MQVFLCCHLFPLPTALSLSSLRLGELVSKMSFNGKEARLAYPYIMGGFTTYAGANGSNALSDEHLHHIHNLILLGQILMLLRARQPEGASRATPVLVAGSNIWKREASATKIAGKGGEE